MARNRWNPIFLGAWLLKFLIVGTCWNHIFEPGRIALFGNYSTWETENPHVEDLFIATDKTLDLLPKVLLCSVKD